MKRFLFALFVAVTTSVFIFPSQLAADEGWSITNWESTLDIQASGSVKVREKIEVDFGSLEKHGIFRDLPIRYQNSDASITYTTIDTIYVTQDDKNAETDVATNSNNMSIKIGDPNETINGRHTYVIDYVVSGVLRSYDDLDELYWNVTGNEWDVPIQRVSSTIRLPEDGVIKFACYQGPAGSADSCQSAKTSDREVSFSTSDLGTHEGMTVALGYTKGMVPIIEVPKPRAIEDLRLTPRILFIFFGTLFFGLWIILRQWSITGRDEWFSRKNLHDPNVKEQTMPFFAHETIVAEYEPPEKLRPAELGVLVDERADTLDVTATIIDLASRGFLTISEKAKTWMFGQTDYILNRTGKADKELLGYEKKLLDSLFATGSEVKLSDLKNNFYDDLAEVKNKLYSDITEKKYFKANPQSTRNLYLVIGSLTLVTGIGITVFGVSQIFGEIIAAGIAIGILGIALLISSFAMPARTAHGREMYRKAKGYELFIKTAEKHRAQFAENENLFNEILPYAIVFGLTEKFARAMKDMGLQPAQPVWYHGIHPFSPTAFASEVSTFSHSLSSAIASAPSSSGSGGGGFSGGGFGGGGGGGW